MKLSNLFSKKSDSAQPGSPEAISLKKFCDVLISGKQIHILEQLNLHLSSFAKASQDQIDLNLEDKKREVVAVYYYTDFTLFNIFEKCVHKIHKNGDKQFIFFTATNNAEKVLNFANILYKKIGQAVDNEGTYNSFYDYIVIDKIAKGLGTSEKQECHARWVINDKLTLILHYHIQPYKQFVFKILEKNSDSKVNEIFFE